jgi:DDE superfamily endonuclease
VLHGAINVQTGDVALSVTKQWKQGESQDFLRQIRRHWRGWNLILFQDRAGQHTAPRSQDLAQPLHIEIRWLPKATPELNAMDHLGRHTKRETQGNRMTLETIDQSAQYACEYMETHVSTLRRM